MKFSTVRTFALSLPEVREAPHHHFGSFRVRGKIFVTVPPGETHLHVFLNDDQRERALAVHTGWTEKLLWGGKVVGLRVDLGRADAAAVKRLVRFAWEHKAPKRLVTGMGRSATVAPHAPRTAREAPARRTAAKAKASGEALHNYLVWEHDLVPGACALSNMTGFDDDWKLLYGDAVANKFPKKARFAMNTDYPDDTALTDSLYNVDMLIVASQPLRKLIEAQHTAAVEFIPVPVVDHKKRELKAPYCIVHPTAPVDCLVLEACKPRYDRVLKTEIDRVKHLVIDEARIPADRLLFRPKGFARVILTHRRLASAIEAAGLTGIRWVELANYPEV